MSNIYVNERGVSLRGQMGVSLNGACGYGFKSAKWLGIFQWTAGCV